MTASCRAERDLIAVTWRHCSQLPKGDYSLSKMLEVSQIKVDLGVATGNPQGQREQPRPAETVLRRQPRPEALCRISQSAPYEGPWNCSPAD